MKLIIAGSRSIRSMMVLLAALRKYRLGSHNISEVVCGEAIGVDLLGEIWAIRHKVKVAYFAAEWEKYGNGAGHIRNKEMAMYGDVLLSIWDGESTGTIDMRKQMRSVNKKVFTFDTKPKKRIKNETNKIIRGTKQRKKRTL